MRSGGATRVLTALLLGGLGPACCASTPAETTPVASASGGGADASGAASDASAEPDPESTASADDAADTAAVESCAVETRVVGLQTSDGIALEADYVASGRAGGKAVVLLHMIPPSNDRSNYPSSFVTALAEAGYSVLNVDRRGAGGSAGAALDAYEGPNGRLDAVAAMAFLASAPCAVAAADVAIIGASNGTTTALDYATEAAQDERPAALAFLSPGAYTENQHTLAQGLVALAERPVFVGYPPGERAWPEAAKEAAGGTWTFVEYKGGQHGSRLFTSNPEVAADLIAFLEAALPTG